MKKALTLIVFIFPFIISGQNIKSIYPTSASQVESVVISIVSQNTTFKSGKYTVKLVDDTNPFRFCDATSVVASNDTLLNASFTFNSNKTAGVYNVVLTNSQTNSSLILENAFHLTTPVIPILASIISINPTVAVQGDTLEIVIKTKNTHFLQPLPTSLSFENTDNSIYPISQTIVDNETINAKFIYYYFMKAGVYDVAIFNSIDGSIRLNQVFTLSPGSSPPELLTITPNFANRLGSQLVTIKGKNTFFKKDSSVIALLPTATPWMELQPTVKIEYLSDTVMTVFFNFLGLQVSAVGLYDISIFDRKNYFPLILPHSFTINDTALPPAIVSFSPVSATQGDTVKVIVRGTNTHFLQFSLMLCYKIIQAHLVESQKPSMTQLQKRLFFWIIELHLLLLNLKY